MKLNGTAIYWSNSGYERLEWQSYINKMINTAGEIEMGSEVLILSKEIL